MHANYRFIFICSFVRSFVRSFTRSFVGWFVGSLVGWFVRSFVGLFDRSFVRSKYAISIGAVTPYHMEKGTLVINTECSTLHQSSPKFVN